MVGPEYSLCDVTGPNAAKIMTDWLDSMVKESDFAEMQELGVNFVRVPLGWWNVYDMPYCPNAPEAHQHDQGGRDDQLVCHRIQEGPKCGGLIESPGEVPVQPVGQCRGNK